MATLINKLTYTALFLSMVAMPLSCSSQDVASQSAERRGWDSEELFPLYGDVKSLTEYQYFVDDKGKADKSHYTARRFTFNTSGDVVSEVMFDNTGNERIVQTSAYNAEGKITEYREYLFNNVELTHLYDYDAEGRLKRFTHLDEKNKVREMKRYNTAGEIVEEVNYNYGGSLESRTVVEFDASGRRTKRIVETPYATTEVIYDEAGNEVEIISCDEIGRVTLREEFIYDDTKRLTRQNNYDAEGNLISYREQKYSEEGTTIEEWSSESRQITKLDRWGDTTEYVIIYNDDEQVLWNYMKHYYVYVRDEQGRIIRQETYTTLAEGDKGELRSITLCKYEDLPNEHRTMTYTEDGTLISLVSHDDEGRLLKSERYLEGKLIAREYNIYDKEGKIIDKGSYNIYEEGTPDEYTEEWQEQTRYGRYGVEEYKFYQAGTLASHSVMEYDAKGNLISHKKISVIGSMLFEYHIEYR